MSPRVSVIIPAYDEGAEAIPVLKRISESVSSEAEFLVVVDDPTDSTVEPVEQLATTDPRFRVLINDVERGPAWAIRYGVERAAAPVAVVTMADGCDDPSQIIELAALVERGVAVAAASRYTKPGQQVGGPLLKSLASRIAGLSLFWFARVGTRDATNSFKAYDCNFVRAATIESDAGFEIGIELVAKARRRRLPVAEIPTIWIERSFGASNFRIRAWLPRYLRWYFHAFGPKVTDTGNE